MPASFEAAAAYGNAPTWANAVLRDGSPDQSLLVATVTPLTWLMRVIFGSGRTPPTPSWVRAGPAARTTMALAPLVPAPPIAVPIVITSPSLKGARIDRFISRPVFRRLLSRGTRITLFGSRGSV